jgi:hypothetical protein
MSDDSYARHAPSTPKLLQIFNQQVDRVRFVPRPLGTTSATLVKIDHAMITFEVRTREAGEALAALPGSAVKVDDGGATGAAGNSVPQADFVDYCVMFTGLEAGANMLSRTLGNGRCAYW